LVGLGHANAVQSRKPYPADGSFEEWAGAALYLSLMTPDATQRVDESREIFNAF
jgi:hypothetical protein